MFTRVMLVSAVILSKFSESQRKAFAKVFADIQNVQKHFAALSKKVWVIRVRKSLFYKLQYSQTWANGYLRMRPPVNNDHHFEVPF